MKLGIIIPDRGDRPQFMENCFNMIWRQTLKPAHINGEFQIKRVGFEPSDDSVDITKRYKKGYDLFRGKGLDLIAFIENDDWYSPDYLKTMVEAWERFHCPDLFGTCYTIYYHLKLRAYFTMEHPQRSSAMNTFIKPDLDFEWPVDMEPFLDLHLWAGAPKSGKQTLSKNRVVFRPEKVISVGMKHGIGKTIGGGNHIVDDRVRKRYCNPDTNSDYPNGFLKTVLDEKSFEFYTNLQVP